MNCPKCNSKMYSVVTPGGSSGLVRNNDANGGSIIEGHSCYNCGKWVEATVHVEKVDKGTLNKLHKAQYALNSLKMGAMKLTTYDYACWKHRDTIDKLLALEAPIEQIARMVCLPENLDCRIQSITASLKRMEGGRMEKMMEIYNADNRRNRRAS